MVCYSFGWSFLRHNSFLIWMFASSSILETFPSFMSSNIFSASTLCFLLGPFPYNVKDSKLSSFLCFYSFFFSGQLQSFPLFCLLAHWSLSLYHLIQYWFLLVYFKIAVIVLFISASSLHFLFVEDFQLFFQYSPELLYIFTVITLNCLLGRLFIPTILSFSSGVLLLEGEAGDLFLCHLIINFFFPYVFGRLVTFVNCGEVTFCRR